MVDVFEQDRMATMERDNQISLHQRRRELADLYNDEMEQWKAEVLANVETQEDRKARFVVVVVYDCVAVVVEFDFNFNLAELWNELTHFEMNEKEPDKNT